jgi:hypothetical protein
MSDNKIEHEKMRRKLWCDVVLEFIKLDKGRGEFIPGQHADLVIKEFDKKFEEKESIVFMGRVYSSKCGPCGPWAYKKCPKCNFYKKKENDEKKVGIDEEPSMKNRVQDSCSECDDWVTEHCMECALYTKGDE